jgi:multidrug resistance efflux pump
LAAILLPGDVTVRRVLVARGDAVAVGQTLIELDEEEAGQLTRGLAGEVARRREGLRQLEQTAGALDRDLAQLRPRVAEAAAALAVAQREAEGLPPLEWKDSPARAQEAYDQAIAHERTTASLVAKGESPRETLEDAQLAVRIAANKLAVARRTAAAMERVAALAAQHARLAAEMTGAESRRSQLDRDGAIATARVRLAESEAALESAAAKVTDPTVRAARGGVVAAVGVKSGDRVRAGTPLLTLATIDPLLVDVSVPSSAIDAVHYQGAADVDVPGAAGFPLPGRIVGIAPLPDDSGAHTVTIEFRNPARAPLTGRAARIRFGPAPR